MLKYADITQNTYVQSWTVTEIMAREIGNFDRCWHLLITKYILKTGRNMWGLCNVSNVRNIKVTREWHETIKLNYKKLVRHVIVVLTFPSTIKHTWMASADVTWLPAQRNVPWRKHICGLRLLWAVIRHHTQGQTSIRLVSWLVQCLDPPEDRTFLWPFISVTVQLWT
jgi:hypothetical protein